MKPLPGTVAAYVLSQKAAFTRPDAEKIATNYWDSISDFDDSDLDPAEVKKWLKKRQDVTSQKSNLRLALNVTLIADFSNYREQGLHVFPVHNEDKFYWIDAAGYLMAESIIPEKWKREAAGTFDYFLDISKSVVKIKRYV